MEKKGFLYRTGTLMIRFRFPILAVILILTAYFAVMATQVRLKSPTIDLFPKNHEYVETYVQYEDVFGGANVVILMLRVKEGDIFAPGTLSKIRAITKDLEMLPAINNYQVLSIAQRKIKKTVVRDVEGYKSDPIMWPNIPTTDAEIAELRRTIYTTGRLHGSLVSMDDKSAVIVAGFFERGVADSKAKLRDVVRTMAEADRQDPDAAIKSFDAVVAEAPWTLDDTLYDAIDKIMTAQRDANTDTFMIGRPILMGQIYKQFPQLTKIFLLTVGSIILVLFLYFRTINGVVTPLLTALMSAVWGVGFLGAVGYDFNPLVIVVPFIISARALSHSVQLIERYIEEYEVTGHRHEAAVLTFVGLFKPAVLSLVADAASVFIVILTPIPLMEKLALMGSFWIMSIVVSNVIFNPIFLTIFRPPKIAKHETKPALDRLLDRVGTWTHGRARVPVLVTTGILFVVGALFAKNLVIGDVHPGSPMLWPGSRYNQDTKTIGETFGNTEILSVVVEGLNKNAIKDPEVLRTMEGLQRKLEKMEEVTTTSSIADLLPEITKIMHGGNPRWELIPQDPNEAGFYLEMIFSGAEPGDLARFITNDFKDASVSVYLRDHRGPTLRSVIAAAKEYIADHPLEGAKFRLAGNYGGLLAAVNEAVVRSEVRVTFLAFAFVFLVCMFAYRSFWAGLFFLIPTIISNYLTYALMGALGIGLDVNALPVVSLGVGLGVDYGLYVVGRAEEEYLVSRDLTTATVRAVATAGRAVLFTASTMVAGIIFWAFSFLRFQAEMGILLAFWMIVSMLGGLILLPTLVILFKPKFVTKGV
jgi:predicted RND superfamily exporter protein